MYSVEGVSLLRCVLSSQTIPVMKKPKHDTWCTEFHKFLHKNSEYRKDVPKKFYLKENKKIGQMLELVRKMFENLPFGVSDRDRLETKIIWI